MGSTSDPKPSVMGYPAAPSGASATPGAAYPYPYPAPPPQTAAYYYATQPAPPQAAAPPPYYPPSYGAYSAAWRHNLLLRRLLAVAVAFFVAIGAVTFIIWLVLRPRLPEFSVSSASVSNFDLSSSPSSQLSASFDVAMTVQNPNHKLGIRYDGVTAMILYEGFTIADTSLPPFYQCKGNTTAIDARLVTVSEYAGDDVVKGITSDRGRGNGAVTFRVRVLASVDFSSGWWRSKRHLLRVYCDDVPIGFSNSSATSGSLLGSPKRCDVGL